MITQDAFTSGNSLMGAILEKMVGINKWQKVFFMEVTMLFLTIRGKINFTQMGRYSSSPEVRFRNMFKKVFDFVSFNSLFITEHCGDVLKLTIVHDQGMFMFHPSAFTDRTDIDVNT